MQCFIEKEGEILLKKSNKPKTFDKDESVIEIKASGICGSDVSRIFNGAAYYYPIIIGHEFSDLVIDSYKKELVGKRVCVIPILPCYKCVACKEGQYANCEKYNYYGSHTNGGMQSYLIVKNKNLLSLPDKVSYEQGAMIEPTAVCLHAVKKLIIQKGDLVHIYGAGTIGALCGLWAKSFGAEKVYFTDIDIRKIDFIKT